MAGHHLTWKSQSEVQDKHRSWRGGNSWNSLSDSQDRKGPQVLKLFSADQKGLTVNGTVKENLTLGSNLVQEGIYVMKGLKELYFSNQLLKP